MSIQQIFFNQSGSLGQQLFTSPGSFTVPPDVFLYLLSVLVLAAEVVKVPILLLLESVVLEILQQEVVEVLFVMQ